MNQCDGCQRGLTLINSEFGGKVHVGRNYYRIGCTEENYTNHIDTVLAKSLATEHAGLHLQGAHTVCPYKKGTKERQAYDEQWKRMMKLAGEL